MGDTMGIQTWLIIPPFFIYIILLYPNTLPISELPDFYFRGQCPWNCFMNILRVRIIQDEFIILIMTLTSLSMMPFKSCKMYLSLYLKTMFTGGGVYRITNVPHLTFDCYREPHPYNRQPTFWTCINLHIYKDTLSAFICSFERFLIICWVEKDVGSWIIFIYLWDNLQWGMEKCISHRWTMGALLMLRTQLRCSQLSQFKWINSKTTKCSLFTTKKNFGDFL